MSAFVKGLWTKKDLAEARRLADAREASGAHWEFADWLLAKEPMNIRGSGGQNGVKARLNALGTELGLSGLTLLHLRLIANAWPKEHRVHNASFHVHERYIKGGSSQAPQRAIYLKALPRDRFGRVLIPPQDGRPRSSRNISCHVDIYDAVVAEAEVAGTTISATAEELITEALDARAWLAEEEAA